MTKILTLVIFMTQIAFANFYTFATNAESNGGGGGEPTSHLTYNYFINQIQTLESLKELRNELDKTNKQISSHKQYIKQIETNLSKNITESSRQINTKLDNLSSTLETQTKRHSEINDDNSTNFQIILWLLVMILLILICGILLTYQQIRKNKDSSLEATQENRESKIEATQENRESTKIEATNIQENKIPLEDKIAESTKPIFEVKQLSELLLTFWKLKGNLSENDALKSRLIQSNFNKIENIFKEFGFEIIDYQIGSPYNDGMNVDVLDTIKSNTDIPRIKEVIQPTILFGNEMIKKAKIIKEIKGDTNE